jgi:DedD protein
MAKSISEEELQLRKRARRRLVGAIALVTITAVFLPMVLDHEPKPVSQDVSIKIPSPDSGAFTSKIVPVVPAAKPVPDAPAKAELPAQAETPVQVPAAKPEAPKVAAVVPVAKPAVEAAVPPAVDSEAAPPKKAAPEKAAPEVKPAAKPVVKPVVSEKSAAAEKPKEAEKSKQAEKPKPATKGVAGFVVQVAALNDPAKAKQMRDQIAATGMKAYTEVVPTAKGNVTRVRAGPFTVRGDADKARDKLKALGLSGNVVPK